MTRMQQHLLELDCIRDRVRAEANADDAVGFIARALDASRTGGGAIHVHAVLAWTSVQGLTSPIPHAITRDFLHERVDGTIYVHGANELVRTTITDED